MWMATFCPFFCLLPSLPAFRNSFSSQPRNCNGPMFGGLVPHYLIIVHLLMSHSRKLAHSSDDAPTAQISPSERCVRSNPVVKTDMFLHQNFSRNLQLLQACHLGCLLGCLDSSLSVCQLDQKVWYSEVIRSQGLVQPSTETVVQICLPSKPVMHNHVTVFIFLVLTSFHWDNTVWVQVN